MKRLIPWILILCLLLSGCGNLLDGGHYIVTPHEEQGNYSEESVVAVSNYEELSTTLAEMVESGTQSGIFSVAQYDQQLVAQDMESAIVETLQSNPIAAYAVEEINYELGTNAGIPAIAVTVSYIHDRTEIRKIVHMQDLQQMEEAIADALDSCDSGIVLYVEKYEEMDFDQWVQDYASEHPDMVMETPQVAANIYPETGTQRVIELKFSYQNSRDTLRTMQSGIVQLFDAAVIYAGGDADEEEKFFKLYSFLIGLLQECQIETSITPAYSLLQHGVGDSRAFAIVYGSMCRKAGLECITVTGAKAGEPRYWNIVYCDGVYYHVDLLQCLQTDDFALLSDADMEGYVWNYSAYPDCGAPQEQPEETEPTTVIPEE